jgi:GNAT superfamily N-acetyltransferase
VELPAEIEIRPAGQDDAGAIVKCLAAAFEPFRAEYSSAAFTDTVLDDETVHFRLLQMHVLVATASSNVVGTVSGVCHGGEGHLRGMAVLPEWRRLGVAGKLLAAIESYLSARGCKRITLDTTLPLQAAMKLKTATVVRQKSQIFSACRCSNTSSSSSVERTSCSPPLNLILPLVQCDSSLKVATNSPTHAAIPIRRIKSCCSTLLSAPIVNASRSPNDNAYFRASS